MASYCNSCGTNLSFLQKLTGRSLCSPCAGEQKQARSAAEREYSAALSDLVSSSTPTSEIQSRLPALAQQAALSEGKLHRLHVESFQAYIDRALEDDHLTEEEETRLSEIGEALDIDLDSELKDVMPRLVVARVNDGRLPTVSEPNVMLKKGEVVHAETNAALLKEVKVREYQGSYRGVSFRVAKGVRFHTGGARGRSVVVSTKLETEDEGILSVTSQRAVYTGARRTIEMPYTKLVNLNVFEDGIQFHLSNRKNPPMFNLERGLGEVVAAVVNAASQQYLS